MYKIVPCNNCGGRGYIVKSGDCSAWAEMCQDCKGEGTIQVKMTNADRIRAMSDEEMAHTILTVDFCEGCEHYAENGICLFILKHPNEPLYDGCKKALLEWLRKT